MVKMKKGLLLVLFLIALVPEALASWQLDSSSVTVAVDISSSLEVSRSADSMIKYITANVSFFPIDSYGQSVLELDAEPAHSFINNEYIFKWTEPVPSNPGYTIHAKVKTENIVYSIREISFPYSGFSDDIADYVMPSDNIDSDNPKIVDKASELASGETDYYSVVFRVADWTKENVKYDLSTMNAKASHSAGWVMAHKEGVCDEITTLFIGLLRAVGIPARFISGIAYTDSPKFSQKWGPHGWAEVYFPGTGWVPFDVTYGQYGYVDTTHIKLKESRDSAESDTRYEWLGHGIEVVADPIVVSADVITHEGSVPQMISFYAVPLQKDVGIGSYNLIEATITNNVKTYISTFMYLARINEMDIDGNNYHPVMLKPLETKKVYWLVKVLDSLDSSFSYTFPIVVADVRNTTSSSFFSVSPDATVFSKEDMEKIVSAAEAEEKKVYSKKIELNCSQENEFYYVYDDIKVSCTAKNMGNFPFRSLNFCFDQDCSTSDLGISQEKTFSTLISKPKAGINKISFKVEGADVSKSAFYDIAVLDEPEVSIDDLEFPAQIEFGKPYTVVFTIKKMSSSLPQDVSLGFSAAGLSESSEVPELTIDRKFLFNLNSDDLSMKPNSFVVSVSYKDRNGRLYTEEEKFEISLINVGFGQRMVIWLHDMDKWLRNLFK